MIQRTRKVIRGIMTSLILFCFALNCMAKDFVVVIDPGHGGRDIGAVGIKTYEKDINLNVALKFGDLIKSNLKDVKVVYTRDDDKYMTLQERANFANKSGGDLFISIHTNSIDRKNKNRKTISGAMTFTLGLHRSEANLEVAKRENSVIELEENYTTTYKGFDPNSTESYIIFEINQSKHMEQSVNFASSLQKEFVDVANRDDKGVRQAGFWVLAATSMPSVLIELDFICNPVQESFLASKNGQNKMAKAIYNAFKSYKDSYDLKLAMNTPSKPAKSNNKKTEEKVVSKSVEIQKNAPIDVSISKGKGEVKKLSEEDYKYSVRRGNPKIIDSSKNEESKKEIVKRDEVIVKEEPKKEINEEASKIIYKVQFLASSKVLKSNSPQLKNLENVDYYKDGGLYKYTYGSTTSMSEAKRMLRTVKVMFKEAFIIKLKNGERIN